MDRTKPYNAKTADRRLDELDYIGGCDLQTLSARGLITDLGRLGSGLKAFIIGRTSNPGT